MDDSTFAIVLLLILAICSYYFYTKKVTYNYWRKKNITTLNPIFPLGDLSRFIFRQVSFPEHFLNIYNKFKQNGVQYGGGFALTTPIFIPISFKHVSNILKNDFNYFHDRPIYYNKKIDPFSEHLIFTKGEEWRNLRKKVSPTFTSGKIKNMLHLIVECCKELDNTLDQSNVDGKGIDVYEVFRRTTIDIIGCCVFGLSCNSLKNKTGEFMKHCALFTKNASGNTTNALMGILIPNVLSFLRVPLTNSKASSFFTSALKEMMQYRLDNSIVREDFLNLFMNLLEENKDDDGNCITFNQLAAQSLLFFIAGSDTVSATLTFCLLEIAQNENVYDKLMIEINETLTEDLENITYEALMGMKYMDMVLKETLRKYPTAPVLLRVCTKNYNLPETDIVIESGTQVWIPIIGLQRDPDYYPDPEKFDPERFNAENYTKNRPFFSFGDGPRVCTGMNFSMLEMKVILITLLTKFKFASVFECENIPLTIFEKSGIISVPNKDIKMVPKIIEKTKNAKAT